MTWSRIVRYLVRYTPPHGYPGEWADGKDPGPLVVDFFDSHAEIAMLAIRFAGGEVTEWAREVLMVPSGPIRNEETI